MQWLGSVISFVRLPFVCMMDLIRPAASAFASDEGNKLYFVMFLFPYKLTVSSLIAGCHREQIECFPSPESLCRKTDPCTAVLVPRSVFGCSNACLRFVIGRIDLMHDTSMYVSVVFDRFVDKNNYH